VVAARVDGVERAAHGVHADHLPAQPAVRDALQLFLVRLGGVPRPGGDARVAADVGLDQAVRRRVAQVDALATYREGGVADHFDARRVADGDARRAQRGAEVAPLAAGDPEIALVAERRVVVTRDVHRVA